MCIIQLHKMHPEIIFKEATMVDFVRISISILYVVEIRILNQLAPINRHLFYFSQCFDYESEQAWLQNL